MLPMLCKGREGFVPRPMPRSQAVKLLHECFRTGGVDPELVHCAFTIGLSAEDRQPLGRWADEKTADVYQRGVQQRVEVVWDKIMVQHGRGDLSQKLVRESVLVDTDIHSKSFFPDLSNSPAGRACGGAWHPR